MKLQPDEEPPSPQTVRSSLSPDGVGDTQTLPSKKDIRLSPQAAWRVLISLMFPAMMMPLASSMSRVALPVLRDDFQLSADVTAWIGTAFSLPFMVLMPVYGRLSDGVGRRRLILAGCVLFALGTAITLLAPSLPWLMVGRAIQGLGTAGIMPMSMALIATIFRREERGKALGTWSSVGPTLAFVGPLAAGFLIERGGWRAAFAPPLAVGLLAFLVVWREVPAGLSQVRPRFLRSFDWVGVLLLAGFGSSLLFFLSSRPITGVAPLQDKRLLSLMLLMAVAFVWWERRRADPFLSLQIFRIKTFSLASICAMSRMFIMSGISFLLPLYLVDIHGLRASQLGLIFTISPGVMALITRYGGLAADRWGSRWPAFIGLSVQGSVMLIFSQLPATTPLWMIGLVMGYYGAGAGFVLAALHRAAMANISAEQMGMAAGLYSMIRFSGAAVGTALAGVFLQKELDRALPTLEAYQSVFLFFAVAGLLGVLVSLILRDQPGAPTPDLEPLRPLRRFRSLLRLIDFS